MKQIRTCIVGMGFIGQLHVETLHRLGFVDVAAIADEAAPAKKAEANRVPKGYADYREMIDVEKRDVIHICTPNSTHFDIAMYAMERGVNVICEKPLTTSVEKARAMYAFAKEKGIVNAVNFNLRFNPQVMQMREMVRNGDVGNIYTVHGSYLQDWLYYDTDFSWRLEPEFSGESRAFADIGSHWIDMAEFITGQRAAEVFAEFETFHKTRKKPLKPIDTYSGKSLRPEDYKEVPIGTEDYATVLFRFENGAKGTCVISQVFAGRKNQTVMSVGGSKCALHWDSETGNELWVGKRDGYNFSVVKDPSILYPETKKIISYPGGHAEGFADTFKQNFIKIYSAVADRDTGKRDFARFEDGLHEMVLCDSIIRSAREQRWIKA
jgi:predicted dehydrogenase